MNSFLKRIKNSSNFICIQLIIETDTYLLNFIFPETKKNVKNLAKVIEKANKVKLGKNTKFELKITLTRHLKDIVEGGAYIFLNNREIMNSLIETMEDVKNAPQNFHNEFECFLEHCIICSGYDDVLRVSESEEDNFKKRFNM